MSELRAALEKKIEELLGNEPYGPVEEELFKWLLFAYFGNGMTIQSLDHADFEHFRAKLMPLLEMIYQWHQSKPDEINK